MLEEVVLRDERCNCRVIVGKALARLMGWAALWKFYSNIFISYFREVRYEITSRSDKVASLKVFAFAKGAGLKVKVPHS